jgi:CRISPR-associated protein Csb3
MNDFTLRGSPPEDMLSHLLLYGLTAILEDAGHRDVTIFWERGMSPRPVLRAEIEDQSIAAAVVAHAEAHTAPDNWIQRRYPDGKGTLRGLMSPRRGAAPDPEAFQAARQDAIDDAGQPLELRLIQALGEPAYWRLAKNGPRPDEGASRFEMVPRNQGNEIMQGRYAKLSSAVAGRAPKAVVDGLTGTAVVDLTAATDSRTASGLRLPGPTDAAVAWCALWGISWLPIAHRSRSASTTPANLARRGNTPERFVLPLWSKPQTPARIRTVLASAQLPAAARLLADDDPVDGSAPGWLRAHGAEALAIFHVDVVGSANAPERRATRGRVLPLGRAHG